MLLGTIKLLGIQYFVEILYSSLEDFFCVCRKSYAENQNLAAKPLKL